MTTENDRPAQPLISHLDLSDVEPSDVRTTIALLDRAADLWEKDGRRGVAGLLHRLTLVLSEQELDRQAREGERPAQEPKGRHLN